MKHKDKKKVIVSQKLYPSQINELSICCFIIKADILDSFEDFVEHNGGRIISSIQCSGVSRNAIFNAFDGVVFDNYFVLTMCQQEITDVFMLTVCEEFEIHKKGNGKAFVLDVLGYMGAKGPFVE